MIGGSAGVHTPLGTRRGSIIGLWWLHIIKRELREVQREIMCFKCRCRKCREEFVHCFRQVL